MQRKTTISMPQSGMNKDKNPSDLQNNEYPHAINVTIESEDGNVGRRQNEPSNLLCTRFDDFKVVGYANDRRSGGVFFFLTNPETGLSKVVYHESVDYIAPEEDREEGEGLYIHRVLQTPLELSPERYQTMCTESKTLIEDTVEDPCLNFSIYHPINYVMINDEKCGKTLYWTDGYNPPRYLNLRKLEEGWYGYKGEKICGDDESVEYVPIDCDKLRIFPLISMMCLEAKSITTGGNLRAGVYEFAVAASDDLGNELSSYESLTGQVQVFSDKDITVRDGIWGRDTGYGIRLNLKNIPTNIGYYKVAVIQTTVGESGQGQPVTDNVILGVYPVTETTVTYVSDLRKERTTLAHLAAPKVIYNTTEGMTTVGGRLIHFGLTEENVWNLQPMVNILGSFIQWQSSAASEDLYKDGVATSTSGSYMRGEVYPAGIRFTSKNGYKSPIYPLVPRPAVGNEKDIVVSDAGVPIISDAEKQKEIRSILANVPDCSEITRNQYWQFWNTATNLGQFPDRGTVDECATIVDKMESRTIEYAYATYPAGTINIELEAKESDDISSVVKTAIDEMCDGGVEISGATAICDILNGDASPQYKTYPTPGTSPRPEFPGDCDTLGNNSHDADADEVYITLMENESISTVYRNVDDYKPVDKASLKVAPIASSEKEYILFQDIDTASWDNEDDEAECLGYRFMEAAASVSNINNAMDCSAGCTCSSPVVDPNTRMITALSFARYYGLTSSFIKKGEPPLPSAAFDTGDNVRYLTDLARDDVMALTDSQISAVLFATSGSAYDTGESRAWEQTSNYKVISKPDDVPVQVAVDGACQKFSRYIGRNAVWTRITRPDGWEDRVDDGRYQIIEAGGYNRITRGDMCITSSDEIRITFLSDCRGTVTKNPFKNNSTTGLITAVSEPHINRLTPSSFTDKYLYIAIDTPIVGVFNGFGTKSCGGKWGWTYSVSTSILPCNYMVALREKEIIGATVSFSNIFFNIIETWSTMCRLCADNVGDCEVKPHEYGDFGYWESSEKYPANNELYDSTGLVIDRSKISIDVFNKLNQVYGLTAGEDGMYRLSDKANLCSQPIRHYRFPDNNISPFMNTDIFISGAKSRIYPIGFTVNEDYINQLLDVAVDSGLIAKEKRDLIDGYEIFTGDRKLNKSIEASGIAYDMWKYERPNGGGTVYYSNYPHNDLSDDSFIYADEKRNRYLSHPFGRNGNNRYSFHSPDLHFFKPSKLPTECTIEGYQLGHSWGSFPEVEDHAKWVILSDKTYSLASVYAGLEAAASALAQISQAANEGSQSTYIGVGFTNFTSPTGWVSLASSAAAVIAIGVDQFIRYGLYRYEWLNVFKNNGQLRNFAYYYTSRGAFNSFENRVGNGNSIRGLSLCRYLNPGMISFNDTEEIIVNNKQRESSVILSFGINADYRLNYPSSIRTYDNSRVLDACDISSEQGDDIKMVNDREYYSRLASPYMKLKNYIPGQYGSIDDISWIPVGRCPKFKEEGGFAVIFGGDIFISRIGIKRKMPYFWNTAFRIGDNIPFMYNDYRNVGYPKYYVNYDVQDASGTSNGRLYPNRLTSQNLNCDRGKYYKVGKFYTYSYGLTSFLVESEINCNLRLRPGKDYYEDFWPNVGDYIDWTQQKNVPIEMDNVFYFSDIYNFRKSILSFDKLPSNYHRSFFDCRNQKPNGYTWSVQDVTENSMTDPWLTYKVLDHNELPTRYGKLIDMRGIESEQILARFENQVSILNGIDVLRDRLNANNIDIGTGQLFAGRTVDYNKTDLGYSGTQSREMISTEFGHYWVDAKRGQMFVIRPNGMELKEITPGMSNWLKRNLPFKILRSKIVNVKTGEPMDYEDTDNKFAGLGLSLGYDFMYKRLFITKQDYIPVLAASNYKYDEGRFFYGDTEISLTNPQYFKDVSFTLSYNCKSDEWVSFQTFTPNFYINYMNYFQTGINFDPDSNKVGLWSHLLTNQSYCVFYGEKHPWLIEVVVRDEIINKYLRHVKYEMECRRYQTDADFTIDRLLGFDKMWIYNNRQNSGEMRLVPEIKNDAYQKYRYPITGDGYQEVIATEVNDTWFINEFFNWVKADLNNVPIWISDENGIRKEINKDAIQYERSWYDRLNGNWFLVRFESIEESRYKMIFKFGESSENIHEW